MAADLGDLLGADVLGPLAAFLPLRELGSWSAAGRAWRAMRPWREQWAAFRLGRGWRLLRVDRWASRVFDDCCEFYAFTTSTRLETNIASLAGKRLLRPFPRLSSPRCPFCRDSTITTACHFTVKERGWRMARPHLWLGCFDCLGVHLSREILPPIATTTSRLP